MPAKVVDYLTQTRLMIAAASTCCEIAMITTATAPMIRNSYATEGRMTEKPKPQTAAERQAKHCRHLTDDDNKREQLNIVISSSAKRNLKALAAHWDTTQQKALERVLLEAYDWHISIWK